MTLRIKTRRRRATILLMVVGLLAMLFIILSTYITLARFDRLTLRQVQRGELIDDVVKSVGNLVRTQMRDQWVDAAGNVLAGGLETDPQNPLNLRVSANYAYEDVPGYRGSRFLASTEPVVSADLVFGNPAVWDYVYPAITQLTKVPARVTTAFPGLTIDRATGDPLAMLLRVPANRDIREVLAEYSREPYMDADGDGIIDTYFPSVAAATEIANATAGLPLRAPDALDTRLTVTNPQGARNVAMISRFDRSARFSVATRAISHGGMVMLTEDPYARTFSRLMFDWLRHPSDNTGPPSNSAAFAEAVADLSANVPAAESLLRRRGALPGQRDDFNDPNSLSRTPESLAWFERNYAGTFMTARRWQRFSIAPDARGNYPDWFNWRSGAFFEPRLANANDAEANKRYDRRHDLTTTSYSDESARIQRPLALNPPPNQVQPPGLYQGQTKFPLWDLIYYSRTVPAGQLSLLQRLTGYFADMLRGHSEWRTASDLVSTNRPYTKLSRLEQSAMLAVNAAAFAAPRDTTQRPGFIDVPILSFVDLPEQNAPVSKVVAGYTPQPYITQVLAYRDDDAGDLADTSDIALAIELYNPNDPSLMGGIDQHALYLPQFAISLNNDYNGPVWNPLRIKELANSPQPNDPTRPEYTTGNLGFPLTPRFAGRSFMTVVINDNASNSWFEKESPLAPASTGGAPPPVISQLPVTTHRNAGNREVIVVKLWKRGTALRPGGNQPRWVLVDQFELKAPDQPPPPNPGGPNPPRWTGSYTNAWRDTNTETYFGQYAGMPAPFNVPARWRCTTAFEPGDAEYCTLDESSNGQPPIERFADPVQGRIFGFGAAGPLGQNVSSGSAATPFGPTVPLHTMNAGFGEAPASTVRINGVDRPASFPTVGFMMFVPRFAHVEKLSNGVTSLRSVSSILRDQWFQGSSGMARYGFGGGLRLPPPADFGHMPLFDNTQNTEGDGYFDDQRAGAIPWGQLVFDYFTVLPRTVDPLRVPGRININAAPWFVLAGLPMFDPTQAGSGMAPLRQGPPAFWSADSGMLLGTAQDGVPRLNTSLFETVSNVPRLGRRLAQNAASYRDATAYVAADANYPALSWADARNGPPPGANPTRQTRYRRELSTDTPVNTLTGGPAYGRIRREKDARGFLSVGELLNVRGFDSAYALGAGNLTSPLVRGDFFKAVGVLALLDTQFVTTRNNTFTVYTSIMDKQNPQSSIRTQMTIDRSNLLPRLTTFTDAGGTGSTGVRRIVQQDRSALPTIISQREIGYFNAQFDD
ncbi:hypothetical protein RAS1_29320 [Phycisphaerae bacterium RAS1]|nr:hypothetical protein RAS1_29320 [Phycisphaerae bacterium RAS1]